MIGGKSAGMSAGTRSSGRPMNGPPGMFNNPLFNSAPQQQAMPQYVAQPSSEGSQPDITGVNIRPFGGKFGQPIYGLQKAFNPTMAVPAWAQSTPSMASNSQFGNVLFNSAPNPYIAPQAVLQPGNSIPAKGGK